MSDATWFADGGDGQRRERERVRVAAGPPRLLTAERRQVTLQPCDLESLLPPEHRARAIWAMVERLDLTRFYEAIRAREAEPGRPATDPKVLVALWLYATCEGIGSAREVARRCAADAAYRWLRGGVPMNHHTLSDFRTGHAAAVDALLTQVLAALLKAGLLTLKRVAQDGLRVRASAGTGSFRRRPRLAQCLEAAREHVAAVKVTGDAEAAAQRTRAQAARERAAREREARVAQAMAELEKVETLRARQRGGHRSRSAPRASTTDGEARTMHMGDGGYRPAYNVQLATETTSGVIVGAQVTNAGTDGAQAVPMVAEIERRLGARPVEYLVDGGFATAATVETLSAQGITVYAPLPERRGRADAHAPRAQDSPAVADWRQRMASEAAQPIYRERAATAERVNADLRTWRTLDRFLVRGLRKTLSVVLWNALAFNLLRWAALTGPV